MAISPINSEQRGNNPRNPVPHVREVSPQTSGLNEGLHLGQCVHSTAFWLLNQHAEGPKGLGDLHNRYLITMLKGKNTIKPDIKLLRPNMRLVPDLPEHYRKTCKSSCLGTVLITMQLLIRTFRLRTLPYGPSTWRRWTDDESQI